MGRRLGEVAKRTVAVDLDQIIHQALLTVRSLTEVQ